MTFLENVLRNLFQPLLLFFYAGFLIPILHVKVEIPKAVYQGLTVYLLLSIGWKGGEELAGLEPELYGQAAGFMFIGFCTNLLIGIAAYVALRKATRLRKIDAATVAGYYGSDSAGTFVTATGVLGAAGIAFAPYMPVMLAVMEIPGCLVALYLVAKMRERGMDANGNMPNEAGYDPSRKVMFSNLGDSSEGYNQQSNDESYMATAAASGTSAASARTHGSSSAANSSGRGFQGVAAAGGSGQSGLPGESAADHKKAEALEAHLALQSIETNEYDALPKKGGSWMSAETLHEVFLNPGIYLLFAGIVIGFIARLQGEKVTDKDDAVFINLFHGFLCVFLLEMGITASRKVKDLKVAGWQFVAFALIGPNVFATTGILIAHVYSILLGQPFEVGTYVLFAVLCGASSYIAVPAVQRLAIPEASPTLPLAASLGVTFSYNVTVGIPVYILIATLVTTVFPVVAKAVEHTAG